jgi:hypothetical protein
MVLFNHDILPFYHLCSLFITGGLYINNVTKQCDIARVILWPLYFSEGSIWSTILLCTLDDFLSPIRYSLVGIHLSRCVGTGVDPGFNASTTHQQNPNYRPFKKHLQSRRSLTQGRSRGVYKMQVFVTELGHRFAIKTLRRVC